jgi:hyperosmotically inducible protein
MLRSMTVVICSVAIAVLTAGSVNAETAQDAKDKAQAAADKTGNAVTDAAITTAVKTKLLADKTVAGSKIDVDTNAGVVTLSGTVSSAAERSTAVRLARAAHGVKSVKDNLVLDTAATTGRADTTTTTKDAKDKDKDLKVVVKDDTKETAGKVKDATKKGAEKTADATKKGAEKTAEGAKKVGSETKKAAGKTADAVKDTKVEVKDDTTPKLEKAGDKTADAAITSAVKTKFLADTTVGGLKIDVDTHNGVVTLTGPVKSAAEKAEAVRLARTTTGVKSVVDKLTIQ